MHLYIIVSILSVIGFWFIIETLFTHAKEICYEMYQKCKNR